MEDSTTKEKILKKIRLSLMNQSKEANKENIAIDLESNIYPTNNEDDAEVVFAQHFTDAGGKFIFCLDENELTENLVLIAKENNWKNIFCGEAGLSLLLKNNEVEIVNSIAMGSEFPEAAMVSCEVLISNIGGIIISSTQAQTRKTIGNFKNLLIFAQTAQVSNNTKEGLKLLKQKYPDGLPSWTSIVTCQNESENHPEIYVFLLDSSSQENSTLS
jgi:L-lactate dehydrogenase complex protein LldG